MSLVLLPYTELRWQDAALTMALAAPAIAAVAVDAVLRHARGPERRRRPVRADSPPTASALPGPDR